MSAHKMPNEEQIKANAMSPSMIYGVGCLLIVIFSGKLALEHGAFSAPAVIAALVMTLVVITFASRSTLFPAVIASAEVAHRNRHAHIYHPDRKVTYLVSKSSIPGFLALKMKVLPIDGAGKGKSQ